MRRIKKAIVKRLALCKRGKNGLRTLFKSADGNFELTTLVKGDAEKGELLAVMWPKGLVDEDGDFSDTEAAIQSMTSSLIQNGGKLDIEHDGDALPPKAAYISEVFTIQKGDPRFEGWRDYAGEAVDVTGGAAVKIQIDDPDLRAAYRDGEWDGVSLFGQAAVEHVDLKAASHRVAARMGGMQETEMTNEELQALLAKQSESMVTLFKSAVGDILKAVMPEQKTEPKTDEPKVEAAPTFTGDPSDPTALADYENALRGFELRKAVLAGDMTADKLAELRKSMTEKAPSVEELNDAGIEAKPEDAKDVRELQVKLFKAQKRSNVPTRVNVADDIDDLAKASEDEGLAIAKVMNEHMGGVSNTGMRIVNG